MIVVALESAMEAEECFLGDVFGGLTRPSQRPGNRHEPAVLCAENCGEGDDLG